jgi:hypothetical protein
MLFSLEFCFDAAWYSEPTLGVKSVKLFCEVPNVLDNDCREYWNAISVISCFLCSMESILLLENSLSIRTSTMNEIGELFAIPLFYSDESCIKSVQLCSKLNVSTFRN